MNHKHNYLLDIELSPKNEFGIRVSTIFLECIDCTFILRDNDIIKYIEELEENVKKIQ